MSIDPKEVTGIPQTGIPTGVPGDGLQDANAVGTVRTTLKAKDTQVAQLVPPVAPPAWAWDAGVLIIGGYIVLKNSMSSSGSSSSGSSSYSAPAGRVRVPRDPCKGYDCKAAQQKLQNIENEIKDRQTDLRNDPGDLAASGMGAAQPGLPPSATVEGHYDLLDFHKANYAKWQAEYMACCGGNGPWKDFKGTQGPEP